MDIDVQSHWEWGIHYIVGTEPRAFWQEGRSAGPTGGEHWTLADQ